jgi:DNA-binding FadR family transcriptional regulator
MPAPDDALRQPLAPPTNLTGLLIERLTDAIVDGKLAPRTRLPTEQALMRTHGVSRTVVREAIAALRAEGLVETRQGSGAFVAAHVGKRPFRIDLDGLRSIAQVIDVLELRVCVEVEAAGLAAERRTKADIAGLREVSERFSAAIDAGDQAIDIDFEFHSAIGSATRNPYFSSFLAFLGGIIIPRRSIHLETNRPAEFASYLGRLKREHEAILDAVADGEVAAARAAMRAHLIRGRDRYLRVAELNGEPLSSRG